MATESEEPVFRPLVVFNHIGSGKMHSHTPIDRRHEFNLDRNAGKQRIRKKTIRPYRAGKEDMELLSRLDRSDA